jgi:hypothetical protein
MREPASVGSAAEVIHSFSREGDLEFRGNHVLSFQARVRAARCKRGLDVSRLIDPVPLALEQRQGQAAGA